MKSREDSFKNISIDMKIHVKNHIVSYWEKCTYSEFWNDVEFGYVSVIECIIFFNALCMVSCYSENKTLLTF